MCNVVPEKHNDPLSMAKLTALQYDQVETLIFHLKISLEKCNDSLSMAKLTALCYHDSLLRNLQKCVSEWSFLEKLGISQQCLA